MCNIFLAKGRRSKAVELRNRPGVVHIVDDDESFRKAIERNLKHAGYEVATYASAEHLLDRLPSESMPALIVVAPV